MPKLPAYVFERANGNHFLLSIPHLPHTCDDAWGGNVIAAACTHVAATVRSDLCEGAWLAAPYIDGNYDTENGISIQGGFITLPKGLGVGVVPDLEHFGDPVASFGV
jgi:L-alanine-DL-glutamate epimerase-like enolase superfamily enzyme